MRIASLAGKIALAALAAGLPSRAQNALQPINFALVAYDQPTPTATKLIRFGNKDIIRYFAGTNVPNGQLLLVTPLASGVLTNTGNMNAFLRITQRQTTILEVPTPDSFNLFQDSISVSRHLTSTAATGTDRFSIDFGGFHAELQALNNWFTGHEGTRTNNIRFPTGIGRFSAFGASGEGTIDGVTQTGVPISGTITGGTPTFE